MDDDATQAYGMDDVDEHDEDCVPDSEVIPVQDIGGISKPGLLNDLEPTQAYSMDDYGENENDQQSDSPCTAKVSEGVLLGDMAATQAYGMDDDNANTDVDSNVAADNMQQVSKTGKLFSLSC